MKVLSNNQQKVLDAIFENPVRSNVKWKDIENLLIALGAELTEGRGSRIRIYLNEIKAVFHRPHPKKELDKGALKSMRKFLIISGVKNA